MKSETKQTLRREWRYFYKYELANKLAWDIRIGLLVGVAVFISAYLEKSVRKSPHLLDVSAALGVAILAVVIAAVSILTVFLTEDYAVLLHGEYPDDIGEVFYPYRLIAAVSSVCTFMSMLGLFLWPAIGQHGRPALLAASLGLAAWATVGTFGLVTITAGHGALKLRFNELDEATLAGLKAFLRERKRNAAA